MPEVPIDLPRFKLKQQLIYDSPATEILIAGDTRSGKSFFVRKSYIIYCAQIPGLIADILRVNYDDVLKNYMVGETSFPVLLDNWEKHGLVKITESEIRFWNGSLISLGHCSDERALRKHQGNPTHLRTIDEAGQFNEDNLRGLGGWLAITEKFRAGLPPKWRDSFPKLWHLTNFIGPGMGYYRRGFLQPREPFSIEEVGQHKRQFIPMFLSDNDSEDPQKVIARIKEAFPDPMVQRALLQCDWRSMGGDFYPEWDETKHVVPDFIPPEHWIRAGFRSFDWGTADPAVTYWWCIADGEEVSINGHPFNFPRGALIAYREWYVCDPEQQSKGGRLGNVELAEGITGRSVLKDEFDHVTVTDSLPFQDRGHRIGGKKYTISDVFAEHGVVLIPGNTDRITGWSQLRSRLIGIKRGEGYLPMIYFADSCRFAREYIPALTRHPSETKREDAAEHGEATHACDAIRLACTLRPLVVDAPIEAGKIDFTNEKWSFDQVIDRIKLQKAQSEDRW